LLDQDGRIADRLTSARTSPQPRLVIRSGGSISGNFSHQVTHEGKTHSYHWGQDGPNAGLCRVGVRNGKFVLLFP
jgi:hypothetical protein